MNGKKTLIIAVIFALVVGGYFLDQQRHEKAQQQELVESRILPEDATLTGLKIHHRTPQPLTLDAVKKGDGWRLTEPVATRVDEDTIHGMLTTLDTARKQNVFEPEGGLRQYGLDNPVMTVDFATTGAAKLPLLKIGQKTPDGNSAYAQLGDSKQIFTLTKGEIQPLTASLIQMRDKRLLPATLTGATTATINYGDQVFTLEDDGGDWKVVHPEKMDADNNFVTSLLSAMNSARTANFIDTPTQNLATYGLDKPYAAASLYVKGDEGQKTYTMLVGDIVTTATPNLTRYAMEKDNRQIYTVSDSLAKRLRPTLDQLRSKQLFSLPATEIDRMRLKMLDHDIPLERGGDGKWHFADDPKTPLDQNTINQKLAALLDLKATRFFPKDTSAVKTGLEAPNVTATIWTKDGKTSQTIVTGRKAEDGDWVYCRFSTSAGKDELIGVDWTKPGQFFITREDLLDKTLISFQPTDVKRLEIQDGATSLALAQLDSGAWEGTARAAGGASSGSQEVSVEPAQVSNLLMAISSLQWKHILSPERPLDSKDIQKYELANPPRWIRLYGADGKLIGALGEGEHTDKLYYVKTGDGTDYSVDAFRVSGYADALNRLFAKMGLTPQTLEAPPEPTSAPASLGAAAQ